MGRYADKKSFANMLRICYSLVAVAFMAVALSGPSNGGIMFIIYQVFYAAAMGGINSGEINLVFDYVSYDKRKDALAIRQTVCGLCGFFATLLATPLLKAIQSHEINIFGIHIYAQQVLSFISFIMSIILILYVTKLIKKGR